MTSIRLPAPFYALDEHYAIDLPGARAVFTTRRGGVSRGPYESLNLGHLTDDEPQAVRHNRATVEDLVGRPLRLVRQVHGTTVKEVDPEGGEPAEADGQVTLAPGLAPAALAADCLPVIVAAPGGLAVLHAGWPGLAGDIIGAGVKALRNLGVTGPLSAAIGPGAGPCCYEVGEDVRAGFASYPDKVRHGANLNLPAIARLQLERAGVQEIHDIGLCTICSETSLLFSHRRDRGVTGRQAGVAWLN